MGNRLPPNVKFEVDDIESPWRHERPFDYIFMRYMCVCILDWPKLTQNIVKYVNSSASSSRRGYGRESTLTHSHSALAPGGWAEFQDFDLQYYSEDGSLKEDHMTLIWINTLLEAAHRMGRDPQPGLKLEGHLHDAGFINIRHKRYKLPIGPWAKDPHLKDVGLCNLAQIMEGLEALSLRLFCDFLKWSEEEVLVLLAGVRRELKSGTIHAMFDL
jgi:hypothetical protein